MTLIELLVVVVVVGVLASVATSSMEAIEQSLRLGSIATDLFQSLRLARSEAIKRNVRVTVCKSASGLGCTAEGNWGQGWIVFEDIDNDGIVGTSEAVIQHMQALPAGYVLTGNSMVESYVSYTSMGRTRTITGAFQAGTMTLCKAGGRSGPAREIVINNAGRVRVERTATLACT